MVLWHAAERVVSLSEEMRNQLVHELPAERVVTIPTGIDTEVVLSELTQAEAKRRLGIPQAAKVVGYAGRLVPIKRLDIFLRVAKRMAMTDSDVRFVIAGAGPEEEQLLSLTREFDVEDKVLFLGYRARVYDVMRAFDLFLLCSDHEGLPRSVLEAMFLGVPVVARRVGGVPEAIEDGITGVLVNSADPGELAGCCATLLADPERMEMMRSAGIQAVRDGFCVGKSAKQMADLYFRLGGV
jgi:glycosyltransferase involved in cell wall biosynthesis